MISMPHIPAVDGLQAVLFNRICIFILKMEKITDAAAVYPQNIVPGTPLLSALEPKGGLSKNNLHVLKKTLDFQE